VKTHGARCWRGAPPKHRDLLCDPDIKRWYDNVSRGSRITADVYLRRLGSICNSLGVRNPKELLTQATSDGGGRMWAYNFVMDIVTRMEREGKAGSYIHSNTKALRSWFAHNGINVDGRIKIRGAQDAPTLRDKHAPTSSELAAFFSNAPPQTRCAAALVAQAGLRLEVVGNYDGSDGLKLGDLPELVVRPNPSDCAAGQISFSRTPAMIVVRPELSKAGHQYFTFLAKEGCEYIVQYLTWRMKMGETLVASSPLVSPGITKPRKNLFVRSSLVGALIRKRLRSCAIKARPYDLRSSFDTSMMLAESRGLIIRDYRVFFMGHKGDIEHRYTLNRHSLPSDVVCDLRTSFERAQKYLLTPQFSNEDDIATQVKKQMLLTVGYRQEELERMDVSQTVDEKIQDLVKQKLFAVMVNNGQRQKVVPSDEVEKAITEGWEWIGNLSNGRAVLKLPS
jgi:integrase